MDEEASKRFEVQRTPDGKFYITGGAATPVCTGTGPWFILTKNEMRWSFW